jgi:hypothetical protein
MLEVAFELDALISVKSIWVKVRFKKAVRTNEN